MINNNNGISIEIKSVGPLMQWMEIGILYFYLLFWMLIDTVSGIEMFNDANPEQGLSVGGILRLPFFVFLVYLVLQKNKSLPVLVLILYFLILTLIHIIIKQDDSVKLIQMTSKVLTPVILFFLINIMMKKDLINIKMYRNIVLINAIVLLVNLYLYFFGVGYSNYGTSSGSEDTMLGGTGFLYAGNEVGVTLIILFGMSILFLSKKSIWHVLIVALLFIAGGIAVMSKTAIFGAIISLFLYFISRFSLKKVLRLLPVILGGLLVMGSVFSYYLQMAFGRWSFFIQEYGFNYLLGGKKRIDFLGNYFNDIKETPALFFIGKGWGGEIENNLFDLLEAFGVSGLLIFAFWLSIGAFLIHKALKNNDVYLVFSGRLFLLLIIISVMAGHVIQSAMAAPFLALLGNYHLYRQKELNQLVDSYQ